MTLFFLKLLNSLFKLLNSETSPLQMGAGFAFGMLVGLSPFWSLHNLILFLLVCLLRVNFSMFFWSLAIFKFIAWIFDPALDALGYWLLVHQAGLREFWISITSGAIWPFFRFYNTIVVGALALGLLLFIPAFFLSTWSIKKYRAKWRQTMAQSKWVKALKATPLYSLYSKYESFREKMSVLS